VTKLISESIVSAFETLLAASVASQAVAYEALAASADFDAERFGLTVSFDNQQVRAAIIATSAHVAQTDKGGAPYIEHPARVHRLARDLSLPAGNFSSAETEAAMCAALLHDVVEDSGDDFYRQITSDDLAALGFSPLTVELVELLTFDVPAGTSEARKAELKKVYLEAIAVNPLARAVKLADTCDNMNKARQAALDADRQTEFAKKYGHYLEVFEFDPATEWFADSINLQMPKSKSTGQLL
jgi:(p)ppGpp synthase/HD superfamily hydrolase